MRGLLLVAIAALMLPAVSMAQSRSSFTDVTDLTGVDVVSSNGGLTYTISMGADPTFIMGGTTYHISDIFAFYVLSDVNDLTATAAGPNPWNFDINNAGTGGIAGFKADNANAGIGRNQSVTLTFDTLSTEFVNNVGFHARYDTTFQTPGTLTSFITPVPEPGSYLLLGMGALGIAAIGRRARRKS